MCSEVQQASLFRLDYMPDRWHLSYGITSDRWAALLRDDGNDTSFFHERSEEALTFFVLGNVDAWTQTAAFTHIPRRSDGRADQEGWNWDFFENLQSGVSNFRADPPYDKATSAWNRHLPSLLGTGPVSLRESVLLFEFDTGGADFNPAVKSELAPFSFLKLGKSGLGHEYDAVLILPDLRTFVFFECKLGSDIGLSLKGWPFLNQFVRALESAYFLTQLQGSPYLGWDFRYVIVAPRDVLEERATHYAHILAEPADHLRHHRHLIERRYPDAMIPERVADYPAFVDFAGARVRHLYWDSLIDSIPHFSLHHYWAGLTGAALDRSKIDRIFSRFEAAGLRTNYPEAFWPDAPPLTTPGAAPNG